MFIYTCARFADDQPADADGVGVESNVRMDLTEWRERHATLVLSKVKVFFSTYFVGSFTYLLCLSTKLGFNGNSGVAVLIEHLFTVFCSHILLNPRI